MKENSLLEKSFAFGVRMFGLNALLAEKKLYAAANQVFRSGTSIGADAEEAVGGCSRKDFVAKLNIAHEEARETSYWLRLPEASNTLESRLAHSLLTDVEALKRILSSILVTTRDGKRTADANIAEEPTSAYFNKITIQIVE